MYSMTTFEWKGGLKNIAIPAFVTEENEPSLVIKTLLMGVENDRKGFMEVTFALDNGSENYRSKAYDFVASVVRGLRFGGYSNMGGRYNFTLSPESGEPLTESMMKKYLLLLSLCGVYTFAPPRVVTETFTGRYRGDSGEGSGVPYGKYLMEKCLKEQHTTA